MNQRKRIKVGDVMTQDYELVDGLTVVRDALRTMKQRNSRALIVRKRDDDDEYGIVLLSDIAKNVLAINRSPDRVNTYEIMSKPVISVSPNMDIRYCARLFENFGIAVAPVVDGDQVVGMVGYDEIVLNGLIDLQNL